MLIDRKCAGVFTVIKVYKPRNSLRHEGSRVERLMCAVRLVESVVKASKYSHTAFQRQG